MTPVNLVEDNAFKISQQIFVEAVLMREGPNAQKTRGRRTENKFNRKSVFEKNQLPFN